MKKVGRMKLETIEHLISTSERKIEVLRIKLKTERARLKKLKLNKLRELFRVSTIDKTNKLGDKNDK